MSLRRMRGGSKRDARGRRFRRSPQAAGGDSGGAGLGCGGGGGNWRRRREKVLGEGESRYLATRRSSVGLGGPWRITQLGDTGPWQRAGDGQRKKTGQRDLFETLFKPRGDFCKITSELRPRHVFSGWRDYLSRRYVKRKFQPTLLSRG